MADPLLTTVVTIVAGFWGAVGGVIYWATPNRPEGALAFLKRVSVGFAAAAVTSAFAGVSPFDAGGAWDTVSIGKLIAAGFVGLAGIASFLPEHLNVNVQKKSQ
ncbi:MAG TPA: hypothetical protein VEY12_11065 [Thermoplasmata archaeon]|nr:hypothetical protein [Thermoplasmata archaeon]